MLVIKKKLPQRSGYIKSSRPHRLWADRKTLLCLYRPLVGFKLDYGFILYGSASKRILQKLDPIRTSPAPSLYAKELETSWKHRRKKLSTNYALKLKTCANNLAYSCVFEPQNCKLFEIPKLTSPLGLPILPLFEDSKIGLGVTDDVTCQTALRGANLNLIIMMYCKTEWCSTQLTGSFRFCAIKKINYLRSWVVAQHF